MSIIRITKVTLLNVVYNFTTLTCGHLGDDGYRDVWTSINLIISGQIMSLEPVEYKEDIESRKW